MVNREIAFGLVGKKGSGKSLVADYLQNRHGFLEVKFAGPLKEDIHRMLGIPMELIEPTTPAMRKKRETWIHPDWGMTIRVILQIYGTDCMRNNFHTDFWIKRLDMWIKENFYGHRLVISDVRFRNEVDYVISRPGGHVIKVIRPGKEDLTDNHKSEIGLDNESFPHFLLTNETTIKEVYKNIDWIVECFDPEKGDRAGRRPWDMPEEE